jgi:hypothetical protein
MKVPQLLPIAVLSAVALIPLTAPGQMRGMGGRSSGISRGSGFSHSVSPSFSSSRRVGARTFAPSGRIIVNRGSFPFRHFHQRPVVFFRGCFGFPCRNRFFFGNSFAFGAPFASYPSYPYYPADYYPPGPPAPAVSSNGNDIQLGVEVQRLSDEIEDLRNEQGRQPIATQQPSSSPSVSLSVQSPAASTIFVFRDGHRISAQNYAISGQTLWILSEHAARKIALADLDRAATEQANAANGTDLHLPNPDSAR